MRQIVIDTETTGREPTEGHRIIEIGAIVLQNRRITQETFHTYLNPGRESEADAFKVHGLSSEFLRDKPYFEEIISDFLAFIEGAELVIHNAPFDTSFLNYELQLLNQGYRELDSYCTITDSLLLARKLHPNQRNSLDALCKRYEVDNAHRTLHGALLDASLLAQVYLRMTSGQSGLFDAFGAHQKDLTSSKEQESLENLNLPIYYATQEELAAHHARLKAIAQLTVDGICMWED